MTQRAALETPLHVSPDHPAFAGHFPGQPILPGVVLLAETLAAIEAHTGSPANAWTLANCKFAIPVPPGVALTLAHEHLPDGGVRFEIRSAGGRVASGALARRA